MEIKTSSIREQAEKTLSLFLENWSKANNEGLMTLLADECRLSSNAHGLLTGNKQITERLLSDNKNYPLAVASIPLVP